MPVAEGTSLSLFEGTASLNLTVLSELSDHSVCITNGRDGMLELEGNSVAPAGALGQVVEPRDTFRYPLLFNSEVVERRVPAERNVVCRAIARPARCGGWEAPACEMVGIVLRDPSRTADAGLLHPMQNALTRMRPYDERSLVDGNAGAAYRRASVLVCSPPRHWPSRFLMGAARSSMKAKHPTTEGSSANCRLKDWRFRSISDTAVPLSL